MRIFVLALSIFMVVAVSGAGSSLAEDADRQPAWQTPPVQESQTMSHLLTAISGKPTSKQTDAFFVSVKSIRREQDYFRLVRMDGAELVVPRGTHMGERMFACMEKIEQDARSQLGPELGDYVHSVDLLVIDGDSVELRHSGKESVAVPLPANLPWLPVRLKEIKLSNIRMQLVEGRGRAIHCLKKIDGIAVVVRSAGVDLNIEPREFWRWKDKEGHTHVVLGIDSVIPKPVRVLFRLPDVVHVRHVFKKKRERAEEGSANSS